MNKPIKEYIRIDKEVYSILEKKCRNLAVGPGTTELEAAFILGQQSVLKLIRDEILVEHSV